MTEEEEDLLLDAEELLERGRIEEAESLYGEAMAFYDQAMTIFEQINATKGIVETLIESAKVERNTGKPKLSIHTLKRALEHCEEEGYFLLQAEVQAGLGNSYQLLGDYDTAIESHSRALVINKQIGNRAQEGVSLGNMGNVYHEKGVYEMALNYYSEALEIHREIGNKRDEGLVLGNIATVYHRQSCYEKSLHNHATALAIHREIANKRGEGIALGRIALVYQEKGDYKRSLHHYAEALVIHREIGNKISEGVALANMALFYQEQGDYHQSIIYHSQALAISQEIGDKRFEGITLGNMGDLHLKMTLLEEAQKYLEQAVLICDGVLPAAAGAFRATLSVIIAKGGGYNKAFALIEKGELQIQSMPLEYGKLLCKKAHVFQIANQPARARKALSHAQKIAEKLRSSNDTELGKLIIETRNILGVPKA